MSLRVTHAKVSGIANPADPTQVGGADWDDDHVVEVAGTPTDGQILALVGGVPTWVDPPTELPGGAVPGYVLVWTGAGVPAWIEFPTELPTGGADGQVLTWASGSWAWADVPAPPNELPAPGTNGQVLTLAGGVPTWANPAGGGGGPLTGTTTYTVGAGQTYATVRAALDDLAGQSIGDGLVVLQLAAGVTVETGAWPKWNHADGGRIVVRGAPTVPVTVNAILSSAFGAGYVDCEFQLSSTAGIVAGGYLLMRVNANGSGTRDIVATGAHEVLAVDSPSAGSIIARVQVANLEIVPSLENPAGGWFVPSVWETDIEVETPVWGAFGTPAIGALANGVVVRGTLTTNASTIYLGDCCAFVNGGVVLDGAAALVGNGGNPGTVLSRAYLGVWGASRVAHGLIAFSGANADTGPAVDADGPVSVDIGGAVFATCDEGVAATKGARVHVGTWYAEDDVGTISTPALDVPGMGGALVISAG